MDFINQIREQLLQVWNRLSPVQRGVLVGLTILGLIMMAVFVNWARTPDYAVAFRDLEESEAGAIVEKLQEQGIAYKLGSGGAILVPRSSVHEVRLAMAKEGLPKGGSIGFELFDGSSLGMTEFSQEVNYRRALEGELARTISSLEAVQKARVHLVIPKKSLYTSQQMDPTASIMVELAPGASLSQEQVRSIRYLVASSVEGLNPEGLTVVDTTGNTLAGGVGKVAHQELAVELTGQQIQTQRSYEQAMEAELQAMLEQLVGPGKVIVQTSVEMDWNQMETVQEIYSPGEDADETVLRSSHETHEVYTGTMPSTGGIPGTASNLPEETGSGIDTTILSEGSGQAYERRDVLHNYEVSRLESRSSKAPGQIERITVSVLLDGVEDPQELTDIGEIVRAAVGLDEERGDVLSVKSLPFDRSFYEQEAEAMEEARKYDLYITAAKWGGLGIFVIVLLLYMRGLLNGLRPSTVSMRPPPVAALEGQPDGRYPPSPVPVLEDGRLSHAGLTPEFGPEEAYAESAPSLAGSGEQPEGTKLDRKLNQLEREEMERTQQAAGDARRQIQQQVAMILERDHRAVAEVIRDWISKRQ